jgi:hypothetical protein
MGELAGCFNARPGDLPLPREQSEALCPALPTRPEAEGTRRAALPEGYRRLLR